MSSPAILGEKAWAWFLTGEFDDAGDVPAVCILGLEETANNEFVQERQMRRWIAQIQPEIWMRREISLTEPFSLPGTLQPGRLSRRTRHVLNASLYAPYWLVALVT